MKNKLTLWIAKKICKPIWKEYQKQLKLKNTQIENLKRKNKLLQMEVNAYKQTYIQSIIN